MDFAALTTEETVFFKYFEKQESTQWCHILLHRLSIPLITEMQIIGAHTITLNNKYKTVM